MTQPACNGRRRHVVVYTDPAEGLEAVLEATLFTDYPAVEWILRLRNNGSGDTPILEDIQALDLRIEVPPEGNVILHHAHGSTCESTDFMPIDTPVAHDADIQMAPRGGRSSNGALPFFNLEWNGGGLVGAIGWSGQWAMRLCRDAGNELTLRAGQQTTCLKLHPGEAIRTPRILLVGWQGDDRLSGHNVLRRVLLEHYVPRHEGEILVPPVTHNTWFTFNTGNDVTEENQLDAIRAVAPMGVEGYWLDAGWYEGGWPSVGTWTPKAEAFPRGLSPLSDAAHELGMKFILWFEPERVSRDTRIEREHPEYVLYNETGDALFNLFNLGDPTAREWLTNHMSERIRDWGVDVFRVDFNIEPLKFWQAADAPDRQGMTEIRYVEGLYAFWDELRRRHPGLAIDNCASGGGRIDLETISRSYALWRSDTVCCCEAMPVQDQAQTAGLSLYVPLHSAGVWDLDPYPFRSVATMGTCIVFDTGKKGVSVNDARHAIEELKDLRPLYLGDYYPLLDISLDERQWCGWQFDRPDLGRGFAVLFRRAQSPYSAVDVSLRGLSPGATYRVTFVDANKESRMTGEALTRLRMDIDTVPASALISYQKVDE